MGGPRCGNYSGGSLKSTKSMSVQWIRIFTMSKQKLTIIGKLLKNDSSTLETIWILQQAIYNLNVSHSVLHKIFL